LSLPSSFDPSDSLKIRALLLDIEGTTTPIDFVFKTLFPFAAEHVTAFLQKYAVKEPVHELLDELRAAHASDLANGNELALWDASSDEREIQSAAAYVRWLIARDSKITPLKALQGQIWEAGYRSGELRGEVYADVPRAFERWRAQGRRIAIFSSGSVLAQRLLFGHSNAGDLRAHIEAYFDTTTGPKREAESFVRIAAALGLVAQEILFVSDVTSELDAARSAGMKTALSLRPGVGIPAEATHPAIESFDEIFPSS
jgi:enolase-phosphatase E1